jgi:hypothetical protein
MSLCESDKITDNVYSHQFPTDDGGDIVICENDEITHTQWVEYLTLTYPNKSIKVINFFRTRSNEEIKYYFDKCELITFITTFDNYDWFDKLVKNRSNQKVVGFSFDETKWDYPLKEIPEIEQIKL